jgi:predicted RNA binding protein YcfA (HicA-like mRNA interferase family)
MKSYSSADVITILKQDGWFEVSHVGDHKHFKHPKKKGKVTVTHPVKTMPVRNLKSIETQAGIRFP